jgi:hypothetical protein
MLVSTVGKFFSSFFKKEEKYLKNYKNPLEKLRKILYNIE